MKKKTLLFVAAIFATLFLAKAQSSDLISEVLYKATVDKVEYIQELVKFDDKQAQSIIEMEFRYLQNVRKAENCWLCNKKKRIAKLKQQRDADLQKILPRDQYIKYDAIDNDRLKKLPPLYMQQ